VVQSTDLRHCGIAVIDNININGTFVGKSDCLNSRISAALPQIHFLISVPNRAHTPTRSPARSTKVANVGDHGRTFAEKRFVPGQTAFSLGTDYAGQRPREKKLVWQLLPEFSGL
jgi:hypothetical protein